MKEDEKKFFITCLRRISIYNNLKKIQKQILSPREIINLLDEYINYKRCWYLLEKWARKGFYNYGVALDLGWFEADKMSGEYKEIYNKLLEENIDKIF